MERNAEVPGPPVDREALGRLVREVWIDWASEQPNPKPSWLVTWEGLAEPDREVDRRIGEVLFERGVAAALNSVVRPVASVVREAGLPTGECGTARLHRELGIPLYDDPVVFLDAYLSATGPTLTP